MPPELDSTDLETETDAANPIASTASQIAPTQFRIFDLFTIITLAAFAFAILVPVLQQIRSEHLWIGLGALGIQFASATATFAALAKRRHGMLRQTGERIGVVFSGELPWKHWPVVKCGLIVAGGRTTQTARITDPLRKLLQAYALSAAS